LNEKVATPVYKTEINGVRIGCADYATPLYPQKLEITTPTIDHRSIGMVCLLYKSHGVCFY
jgi:hypothetical protein